MYVAIFDSYVTNYQRVTSILIMPMMASHPGGNLSLLFTRHWKTPFIPVPESCCALLPSQRPRIKFLVVTSVCKVVAQGSQVGLANGTGSVDGRSMIYLCVCIKKKKLYIHIYIYIYVYTLYICIYI